MFIYEVYLLREQTSWHICLYLMLLILKTVSDPSSESCRNMCIRRVWIWWDDILPHESLAQYITEIRGGESQREKKGQRSSTQDDPVEGNEGGMHCGNSELLSSQMISTDTGGKCWSRIHFFFPIAVITMLFKYAYMCDAEVQLLNAWKPFWCIFFIFSPKSSHGMMCLHSYAWRLAVWWKVSYIRKRL